MINDILNETKSKMQSTVNVLKDDLQGMRGNRASTSLVDRLRVEYYGQETELRQLANISTPEAMQILIRPYDTSAVSAIERAIQQSDLGINPNVDGSSIRLNMPALTRERRQELVRLVGKRLEEAKVAIRNIRRSANQDLAEFESEKMISEDEKRRGEDEVQKLTDEQIKLIEELGKQKEADLMEV
ncbi:MAG: ribosome recycling factor [Anaerolineaceae bacterium]|nr:MAG: ribosome recycling factor [Anaerolineaceae bacterium]